MNEPIKNRYDFVLIFDVQDGNPNGDPDAGNLPRVDPETGRGLVTDVCLKRKIRNFVQMTKEGVPGSDIYVKEKAVLGLLQKDAFKRLGIATGEESRKVVPDSLLREISELVFPDGLSVDDSSEDEAISLVVDADADKKAIQTWIKEAKPSKEVASFIKNALKDAKPRRPTGDETKLGREEMCKTFFDVRTFGAVMALKSAPNCGQVRGPVQMTFGRSMDRIVALEHAITRMAVATEAEAEKQHGDNRTMGRKTTVPYGLYIAHGFVSAHLAQQTGFGTDDLALLWQALCQMFEHDRSAARGLMATQKLIVFKHKDALGNAPAHKLFDLVKIERKNAPPRSFEDYAVTIDKAGIPEGVELIEDLE